jgi:hypothetical protein
VAHVTGVGVSFDLSDEQRELRALAHEFAERELRPIAREWDEREDCPPELLAKAAALGLTSHAIPVEYGGGGVSAVTSAVVAEELSWGCAGLAAPIGATMFPVRPLLYAGTESNGSDGFRASPPRTAVWPRSRSRSPVRGPTSRRCRRALGGTAAATS